MSGNPVAGALVAGQYATPFLAAASFVPDTTPPVLVSSRPAPDAGSVVVTERVELVFDEPMNRGALQVASQPFVDLGPATWSNGDRTATFPTPRARAATIRS
jgi:hypothetical protein